MPVVPAENGVLRFHGGLTGSPSSVLSAVRALSGLLPLLVLSDSDGGDLGDPAVHATPFFFQATPATQIGAPGRNLPAGKKSIPGIPNYTCAWGPFSPRQVLEKPTL